MRRHLSTRFTPAVERAESRVLLTALPEVVIEPPVEIMPTIYPPPMVVSGVATGTYSVQPGRRWTPPVVRVGGTGDFLRMGSVQVQGQFPTGRGPAIVTISNAQGTVELELTRTSGRLGAGQTSLYDFRVTRATGSFAEFLRTTGVAELTLSRIPRRGAPTFSLGINPILPA